MAVRLKPDTTTGRTSTTENAEAFGRHLIEHLVSSQSELCGLCGRSS
jgi:hypothetical protein